MIAVIDVVQRVFHHFNDKIIVQSGAIRWRYTLSRGQHRAAIAFSAGEDPLRLVGDDFPTSTVTL